VNSLLPPWPLLSVFLLATLVVAVTPGPGVVYIITRTLTHGERVGLISVASMAVGNFANALAASLGLAALFAISPLAFSIVKYVGALYLIFLGIQTWRNHKTDVSSAVPEQVSVAHLFRDALIVSLFNPKITIFFAAFLPQFISAGSRPIAQSVTLGALFVLIAGITDSAYALAAKALAPMFSRTSGALTLGRYFAAGALIGLGIFAAMGGPYGPK